jgi:hypothetical protein
VHRHGEASTVEDWKQESAQANGAAY